MVNRSIMMRHLLLFLFQANCLWAQQGYTVFPRDSSLHRGDLVRCGHNLILIAGFHKQAYTAFELSFGRGYSSSAGKHEKEVEIWKNRELAVFGQSAIGTEILVDSENLIYAPKISSELSLLFPPVCISRLNLLYYTDFKSTGSLKYRHEIGFTYMGRLNVTYGYMFAITNRDYYRSKHSINLQYNLFLGKRRFDLIR